MAQLLETFLAPIIFKVVMNLLNKRETDPDFRRKSDEVYQAATAAKSKEERRAAVKAIQDLASR